ncbi:MAG: hypothetical protein KDA84_01055 [Planctomycetaceae bacterium]|nr:hypothetical protein [Planctomycetaceae bacterium]
MKRPSLRRVGALSFTAIVFALQPICFAQITSISQHETTTPTLIDGEIEVVRGAPAVLANDFSYIESVKPTEMVDGEPENPTFGDWLGYNSQQSDSSWLANDEFGMFSLESYPNLRFDEDSDLSFGTGFHFLNGPHAPDLPPRLFDFQMAYQTRRVRSESFILDLKLGVGAFSDFEGSARDGIRFPGHAVLYNSINPHWVSVLGVEVLDRDDISLLPVGGFVIRPNERVIYELVFPKPRVQARVTQDYAAYIAGELGGGTWAIERGVIDDNMTYRDLRLLFGIMELQEDTAFEFGWAFDRTLKFRSGVGNTAFEDAVLLRFRTHY